MSLVLAIAMVAAITIGTHQAQLAADMAAISGSKAALYGADGCQVAQQVAQLNKAGITRCSQEGFEITLSASQEIWGRPVTAQARAGPWPATAK